MLQAIFNETLENTVTVQEYSSGVCFSLDSQHHRRAELGRTSGSHLVQPSCSNRATQSWLPRTVSSQFLKISRDRDFSTYTSAHSPSHWKIFSWRSERVSHVLICAHCLAHFFWAPISSEKKGWLHPLCNLPLDIHIHWKCFPVSTPGWTVPVLSVASHRRCDPTPSSS